MSSWLIVLFIVLGISIVAWLILTKNLFILIEFIFDFIMWFLIFN